jgi:hypothetical protein
LPSGGSRTPFFHYYLCRSGSGEMEVFMGYRDEKLWEIMICKANQADEGLRPERQTARIFISGVEKICDFAVDRSKTIQDTFPFYTLHDETHICNVMNLMIKLLGNRADKLTRDEAAMLVITSCCHDVGMSFSDKDRQEVIEDSDRLNKYLDKHHAEYVKAYPDGAEEPVMTDEMIQNYFRSIHHERVRDLLCRQEWPEALEGSVDRNDLIIVCMSHGQEPSTLSEFDATPTVDLRLCAVLIRLADILDFDTTRAPKTLYDYENLDNMSGTVSYEEWNKHFSSRGFKFTAVDRSSPYPLPYTAICKNMQIEHTVQSFLNWVDQELDQCGRQMARYDGKWKDIVLPEKVKREIKAEGYVSGEYRLTLDQEQVMDLLAGRDLYRDPSVFVRELMQNAIDAVRTREKYDHANSIKWKPQINITSWMDAEGYYWFRIEDNGIGMTEETIRNYFLKIGRSYYNSDEFKKEKRSFGVDTDYMPISRFGIGILSCFIGGDRIEVSTKHFNTNSTYDPSLRLSMEGMNGYYYLANKDKGHNPSPMPGITDIEKRPYRTQAGTVIAVRTNIHNYYSYSGFREIVEKYLVYPQVPVHYSGPDGEFDFACEQEFMNAMHELKGSDNPKELGQIEVTMTEEQLADLQSKMPMVEFEKIPSVIVWCTPLDLFTNSPYLSGATLSAGIEGKAKNALLQIGKKKCEAAIKIELSMDESARLNIRFSYAFSDGFEREMQLKKELIDNINNHIEKWETEDEVSYEIKNAILSNGIEDPSWWEYIKNRFHMKKDVIKKKVDTIYRELAIDFDTKKEVEEFVEMNSSISYMICDLSEYIWFTKWFYSLSKRIGKKEIIAHNGISIGSRENLIVGDGKILGAIVLLKDKYRPEVDISRDAIKRLNLETASELTLMTKRAQNVGRKLKLEMNNFDDAGYPYIKMKTWISFIKKNPEILKSLCFNTSKGSFDIEELRVQLKNEKQIEIREWPCLNGNGYSWSKNSNNLLYSYLCVAALRLQFDIRVDIKGYNTKIHAGANKVDENFENLNELPISFFLEPLDKSNKYLTNKSQYYRNACNSNHPLSSWIIEKQPLLEKRVPGILQEMLRALAEKEADDLISTINSLLDRLRALPGGLFTIHDNVYLDSKDLL